MKREDATLLVPGEITETSFKLYATSVLIKQEHQIQIAIAGYDGSVFERYPVEGALTLTFQRNNTYASFIDLPVKERP
jgi:predicted acyl esterase